MHYNMNSINIKSDLHKFIDQINDKGFLTTVHTILSDQVKVGKTDFWDELTENQKADIEAGLSDLESGKKRDFKDVISKY